MKIRVRLYGTLKRTLPTDEQGAGIEIEVPDGARVKDLLGLLGISDARGVVLVAGGRVLGPEDELQGGIPVNVFEAIGGG